MNIPKRYLIHVLDGLCQSYKSKSETIYESQLDVVGTMFQIPNELITANISNIITEDFIEDWGTVLLKCIKEHQTELGIDFD